MLSIGKLAGGAEHYYLESVATGREEYYTGAGEAPGYWLGSGAATLGLFGEVAPEQLSRLLAGGHPADGGALVAGAGSPRRVAGFDLTFSAPKSVSALWALGGEDVARAVQTAHDDAVADALAYLERHAALARRGRAGERTVATGGLTAAAFRHRTSRNGDPQLHTHLLAANAVEGADGKWSALHATLVYHHGRTAGFVYQAALRHDLVAALGVRFGPVRAGTAEMEGVDPALCRDFSTRRAEVTGRLAELGASSARAAQLATLETRRAKELPGEAAVEQEELRARWCSRAREAGHDPDGVLHALGPAHEPLFPPGEAVAAEAALLSPEGLTAHRSTFERRDALRAVAERLADGARLATLETLADGVMASSEVVGLGRLGRGGEQLCSTRELLALEAELIARAEAARSAGSGQVGESALASALAARPSLSPEQAAMVEHLTRSGAGVEVVVGKAGAGKTFALDAARAAWEQAGFRVQGAALAARAAAELQDGAGIPSGTLASLLRSVGRGEVVLSPRDVVVLDEAGMVGSRDLHRLLSATLSTGAKAVLVGDPRQLPEIEAGGALAALAVRLGACRLEENRRQEAAWERAALDELREGDVELAVRAFDGEGRVHRSPTAAGARAALVSGWSAAYLGGADARIFALRRSDVEELNAAARAGLRQAGRLGADLLDTGGRGFAAGDEVLCLRNDRRVGVLNGTRGRVVAERDGGLVVATPAGERHLPATYLEDGRLAHGYASTVHKAQGGTVERAFVLGGDALYREAGYVALSRARAGTELYVVTGAFENGHVPDRVPAPDGGLVAALSRSRAQELATASLASQAGSAGHTDRPPVTREEMRAALAASLAALAAKERSPDRVPPGAGLGRGR